MLGVEVGFFLLASLSMGMYGVALVIFGRMDAIKVLESTGGVHAWNLRCRFITTLTTLLPPFLQNTKWNNDLLESIHLDLSLRCNANGSADAWKAKDSAVYLLSYLQAQAGDVHPTCTHRASRCHSVPLHFPKPGEHAICRPASSSMGQLSAVGQIDVADQRPTVI
jgi:hypothetical protein